MKTQPNENVKISFFAGYLVNLKSQLTLQISLLTKDKLHELNQVVKPDQSIVHLMEAFIALFAGCTWQIPIDVLLLKSYDWPHVKTLLGDFSTCIHLTQQFFDLNVTQKFTYANYHKCRSLLQNLQRTKFSINQMLIYEFLKNAVQYIQIYDQECANNSFTSQKAKYQKVFSQWQSLEDEQPQILTVQPIHQAQSFSQLPLTSPNHRALKTTPSTKSILQTPSSKKGAIVFKSRSISQHRDQGRLSQVQSYIYVKQTPKRKVCFHDERHKGKHIQQKIDALEQQINKLQHRKRLLEWDAVREAKQITAFKEKQVELKEIEWFKDQQQREQHMRTVKRSQQHSLEREMSSERLEFVRSYRTNYATNKR